MPSEAARIRAPWPVDLSRRAEPDELPEWMDEPCSYEDFRQCLVDLAQVNTLTFAARPTLDFLERLCDVRLCDPTHRDETAMNGPPGLSRPPGLVGPLRIVDVGCGGGDMLRRIARWAARRDIAVQLTGIDLNAYAAHAAQEFSNGSAIEWLTGDAFTYNQPVDVVLSSLFTHHLATPEIVRFVAWSEAMAQRGWFVNDLCREATPYRLFGSIARLMRWHRFVQHDGPVSFRRSVREDDWRRMMADAGLGSDAVTLRRWTPGRLCVERIR
jgi:2-polyprenyl-3-methyl-5-hydroxy-6-metoxy-1,4-benzoquinol methylase